MSPCEKAALMYTRHGWCVLPVNANKRSLITRWPERASTDPEQIKAWWAQWPDANVAIRTGRTEQPLFLVVLDVDPRNGAADTIAQLTKRYGRLPRTIKVATGGGGAHLYFWSEEPVHSHRLGPGVEIKAEGAYVVAPPSVHTSGVEYKFTRKATQLPLPAWVLENQKREVIATPPSEWVELLRGVDDGKRDTTAARLAGHLLARDVDPYVVLELLCCWDAQNRPPKGSEAMERIVGSIARKEARKRRAAA